ncbi:MAG: alpha/beta hydrolase [Acidimicrobiia bacterium]|nr:alpha/beta hydrolase [Acidimicrobiia bacterium]
MKTLALSLALFLGVAAWAAGSGTAGAATTCDTPQVTRNIEYVSDPVSPLQRLDVYGFTPSKGCASAPVMVYVHGGGWRKGDKRVVSDKARFFNGLGDVFVSVNYRLSDPPRDPNRPIHPAHAQDVGAAVTWVEQNIGDFGGDGDHLALLGHSAGAHLVALVGLDDSYIEQGGGDSAALRCVLSDDTESYDLTTKASQSPITHFLVANAFGRDESAWPDASPINHVGDDPHPPDFLVIRRGDAERQAGQTAFANALEAAGGNVTILDAPGYTHGDVNHLIGAPNETVITPTIKQFTQSCLG